MANGESNGAQLVGRAILGGGRYLVIFAAILVAMYVSEKITADTAERNTQEIKELSDRLEMLRQEQVQTDKQLAVLNERVLAGLNELQKDVAAIKRQVGVN